MASIHTPAHAKCFFIPSYIHERIVASNLDEKTKQASKAALEVAREVREGRKAHPSLVGWTFPHPSLSALSAGLIYCPYLFSDDISDHFQAANLKPIRKPSTGKSREIFDCGSTDKLPGKLIRTEGSAPTKDRQINNCYTALGTTYDFYKTVFGRNSLDNAGLPLHGCVHYKPFNEKFGFDNAFWDGTQMVFGDGDGIAFDYFTDSLDVCAHELSHGFVENSSPLTYKGESGALNESMADVFACMVEHWFKNQTAAEANWLIGETIFTVSFRGDGLRTFTAYKAFADDENLGTDPQPKHMKDFYKGSDDDGGVHINSGIPNHAFYLAAMAIGGHSWEKVGKVWYQTMVSGKIPQDCTFVKFAETTVEVAGEVFPADPSVGAAVKKAWEDVGVLV